MNAIKASIKNIIGAKQAANLWEWRNQSQKQIKLWRKNLDSYWRSWKYAGDRYFCPCCGGSFSEFLPYGSVEARQNAQCPRCGSLERHRLLWLYLQNHTNLFSDSLRLLHIAPERWFQKQFQSLTNLDYLSADLEADWAMVKMDITDINYPDASFDVIICNHVLEHIPADHQAMSELSRILKPDGWAILQVPIDLNRELTYEDFSITSPEGRKKAFGQKDHVRIYGRDYPERLAKAGFRVTVDKFGEKLSPEEVQKYSLMSGQPIYRCTKS